MSRTYYGPGGSSSGPTIINKLFDSGVINEKVFAVHFDSFGGSTVEFGGYSPNKIIPNVPLTYFETAYAPTWQVHINAFRVGEKPTFANGAKSAFYFPQKKAYFDTFSPFIELPSSNAATLFAKMFHSIEGLK